MRDFQKIECWQISHQLVLRIYQITRAFPKEEIYSLTSQIRRSASSIPTNMAEGCGRNSNSQLHHFFTISAGSTSELQYQLLLSKDLGYISENLFKELETEVIRIRKMIYSYCEKLNS